MATGSGAFATPAGKARGLGGLIATRRLPYLAARLALMAGRTLGRPTRIGTLVLAARYEDVTEALARDLDFIVGPINGPRFDDIGYHFVLGMDRSGELAREREVLYTALGQVDFDALRQAAAADIANRVAGAGDGPLDIVDDYARPVAAATASRLFGIAPGEARDFMDATRAIFHNAFLNAADEAAVTTRALAAAAQLTVWFDAEIRRRTKARALGDDMMGALLKAGAGKDLTRRTLGGMLVGSIDTTATAVAKIVAVLLDDPRLLAGATADVDDLARLNGWCLEALRLWPQAPLLRRKVATDTRLGRTKVRAGDSLILLTQAAMLDPDAFPHPERIQPDRPVADYLHYGQGLHPCAGRAVNYWQIPMLLQGLLRRRPTRRGAVEWAGPFPAHLNVHFDRSAP